MSRPPQDVRTALATAAGLVPFDTTRTWRDVLVDGGGFSRPGDPDRALLDALAHEYPELDRHADTLPARLHVEWLERVLAVPRLPVVPDQVVAHATVDPKLAPAVLPRGTVLRGGKDAAGAERRYATADALTAYGATVVAVRSLVPGGPAPGLPGLAGEAAEHPMIGPLDPTAGGHAPHTLRLHSPLLTFEGGTMRVQVRLHGASSAAGLAPAVWSYPRPDGSRGQAVSGPVSGNTLTVELEGGCGAPDGLPWLEAVLPPHAPLPTSLTFTQVRVSVVERSDVVPQAAYLNDGLLDVTKEFQPFGAVAKRGDALYLRCDEAFGKPLATVSVAISVMSTEGAQLSPSAGGTGIPEHLQVLLAHQVGLLASLSDDAGPALAEGIGQLSILITPSSTPLVDWQRRVDGRWETFTSSGDRLRGFTSAPVSGAVCSEAAVVGGESGHLVRAFLAEGDFGWTAYQQDVAAFATQAATGTVTTTMPVPPTPPIVSRVTLGYTTGEVAASRVTAVNGWSVVEQSGAGAFRPFTRAVSQTGDTGMVAFGLDLPDAALGSSVSVHLGVDSAAPCGSSEDPDAAWQWWDGASWVPLAVADGSRLLRESGLVRFVAPTGWGVGCPDAGAATGRWVRMVTGSPERIGVITAVTPDAVVAHFVSQAADPALDPSPATALPPGTIKGTLAPVAGVKKVTNLASVRGRGPEGDDAYRRRASALARHRGRAITAWDYEELVAVAFAEVAAVRCLPHTAADGSTAPGSVGIVVVPDRPADPSPRPSVSLAGRINDVLAPLTPVHASVAVLCAAYVPVTVVADVLLRPGVAALTGRAAVTAALETWLHPAGAVPTRWGRGLYRSALEAFLDALPDVDAVGPVLLRGPAGLDVEQVEVDPCRGLYCSSGTHLLDVQEQL